MITIHHTPHCTLSAKVILCSNDETIANSGLNVEGCDSHDIDAAIEAGLAAFGDHMVDFWGTFEDSRDCFFHNWNEGKYSVHGRPTFRGRWFAANLAEELHTEDEDGEPLEPMTSAELAAEKREAACAQTRAEVLLRLCDDAATRAAQKVLDAARKANAEWLAANPAEVDVDA